MKMSKYTASDKYAKELEKYTKSSIDFGVVIKEKLTDRPLEVLDSREGLGIN